VLALAKLGGRWAAIIITAIVTAVGAYRSASSDASARVQESKNKSEAGYQVTRQAMEAVERRVLTLEQAIRTIESRRPPARRGPARPAPAPTVTIAPARPAQLPGNLDIAERQVYRGEAPAPRPDAGR
jgi:hypothetical protein